MAIDFRPLVVQCNQFKKAISAFVVDDTDLQKLNSTLWSGSILQDLLNMLQKPIEGIVSLHIVPAPGLQYLSTKSSIKIGTEVLGNVEGKKIQTSHWYKDMGPINIPAVGSYLDTSQFCKISIYLPFIGMKELDPAHVVGKNITLRYSGNVLNGNISVQIKCGSDVLYSFCGNAILNLPLTSRDYQTSAGTAISSAIAATSGIATAIATGNPATAIAPLTGAVTSLVTANNAMAIQYNVNGTAALYTPNRPFILILRTTATLPANYAQLKGLPSNKKLQLNTLTSSDKGSFFKFSEIHIEHINATEAEANELENILKEGIIY